MLINLIRKIIDKKELCCFINTDYPDYTLKISNINHLMKKGEHYLGKPQELLTPKMKIYLDIENKLIELDTVDRIKKL